MVKRGNDLRTRLLATFRPEAREHLETITSRLLALERGLPAEAARSAAEETFRAFHTLKGAARSVSFSDVERLSHACEAVFSGVTRGQTRLTAAALKALRETVNAVERLVAGEPSGVDASRLIERLEAIVAAAEPPASVPETHRREPAPIPPSAIAPDTLRLATAKVDTLLVCSEDFLTPKLAAGERAREARGLVEAMETSERTLAGTRRSGGDGWRETVAALGAELKVARTCAADLAKRLLEDERVLVTNVDALQSAALGLRMSPAATALTAFPSMLRDLAESQGKEVEWVAHGTGVEIDRKVIETIKDPLMHLVRNAVDHGIETPGERTRAGKQRRGRVDVRLTSLEGGQVEVRVEDDGAGIHPDRLKAAAVRLRQLTPEQAETLTPDEALDLVFRSGVSTAPVITAISGHGLGLPIVRERVESLGGEVRLETRAGKGTTVRMVVPASIATFSGLLLRSSGRNFLIGTNSVERVLRVNQGEVRSVEGRDTLFVGGHAITLALLSSLLGLPAAEASPNGFRTCVVLAASGERMALVVDEILGEREVVVKELRPPLVRVRCVAGAGLLGSGELALILRPADLLRSHPERRHDVLASRSQEPERVMFVLVVDDSITTRTMERNLLEAAGYRVQVAVDGVEAWTALKSGEFDLVVSDVDMPRMDGFELTQRIRADPELAGLPVVLVTAMESREDKERGIEVGANAYVVKSSFDQSNLLEILARLS